MPDKLTNLIQFFQLLYARKLVLETPVTSSDAELQTFYELCYTILYKVALQIQKESYQSPLFEFSQLRKYYPVLDNVLSYLQ